MTFKKKWQSFNTDKGCLEQSHVKCIENLVHMAYCWERQHELGAHT